jgi:N12 class adenine-specific DNA methylase/adenine-specific DNA methylase
MNKLSECKNLLQQTRQRIISSAQEWKAFLKFSAQIYKYDFTSVLLIYAQRPDATALAPIETWNRVGRRVNSGAHGIPILTNTNSRISLSYVFDVSDTNGAPSTLPTPWKLKSEYQDTVLIDLEERYGIAQNKAGFDQRIQNVIEAVVQECYSQYFYEIIQQVNGTPLENLDISEIDAIIQEFFTDSITQMIYSRIAPESRIFESLIFDDLPLFTNSNYAIMLSTACLTHAGILLRQIESSVKQIEHEQKIQQRRTQNVNQIQRAEWSALSSVGHHSTEVRQATDQIRDDLQKLSSGDTTGQIRNPDDQIGTDGGVPQEGGRSKPVRDNNAEPTAPKESTAPNGGYHENDPVQQLAVQDSRGNGSERRDLSEIDLQAASQEAAFSNADNGSDTLNGESAYNAFISENEFHDIYLFSALVRRGDESRQTITDFYQTNPKVKDAIAFLKKDYGFWGGTITYMNGVSGFFEFSGKGLRIDARLPQGEYSRSVSWTILQKEIRDLVADGRFLSKAQAKRPEQLSLFGEMSATPSNERKSDSASFVKPHNPDGAAESSIKEQLIIEPSQSSDSSSQSEPEEEEFLNFDPPELKKMPKDPERQNHVDEMLKYAEEINRESRKNLFKDSLVNFHYPDMSEVTGGQKTHYRLNVEAIRLLKQIESDDRPAAPDEQAVLAKYVGWGGISQAFDKSNTGWQKEYQELKDLLTSEEYEAARASTLTAFYTPPAVIGAIHTALQSFGFTGGNILEPSCGTGRFFGYLPPNIEQTSNLFGVELDGLTGRITQQLYQKANIQIKGFEKAAFPDNFFDVAIGNVPFGDYKVPDKRYEKHNFLIHDYFFARSLDKVRPGGLIVYVTSKGTLDKSNNSVRRYIAQRAELVGAIRLPNTMMKAEANTEVTADIIFLKKRERMVDIEPDWVNLTYTNDGVPINTYYADHPEMLLGTMVFDSNMYGSDKDTALIPHQDSDWRDELTEAILLMHTEYTEPKFDIDNDNCAVTIPADPNVKNFSYTVSDDGNIYYRENSQMVQKSFTGTREHRIRGMIEIRDAMREVIRVQSYDYPDEAILNTQATLNKLYDTYVKKYGSLISPGNHLAFSSDSDYPLLTSLENMDDDHNVTKAAIFTKRTIRPPQAITHVDTAVDALPVCLNQKGRVDIPLLSMLTDKSEDQIISDLFAIIFKDPIDGTYLTSEEYLSGNVREKLSIAEDVAANDEQYRINVNALKKVQPEDLDASQIDIRLGSPLLESEDIKQFISDQFNPPSYAINMKVIYLPSDALWKIKGIPHGLVRSDITASKTFGTHRIDAYSLLELSLNQKSPTIRDRNPDDTYEINPTETAAAREKQKAIENKFQSWVFSDPDRRQRLVHKYNDVYNNIRLRQYDGSHLTYPGMNPGITMQNYQSNAVARILSSGNTLLAHCVGAGKTYEMIAAGMEAKRLGLCNKNMYIVPGHLIDQWGSDILKLYPGANVLLATKNDFEKSKRQRLISRIATGDYDAIVIANTSFEKIPVSPERREKIIRHQISAVTESMELAAEENGEDWTVKQMERTKKSLEEQLEKLSNQSRKDDLLTFEELGVDQMFVDEAHYYKNLFVPTKMTNVAGVSSSHALKSTDMLMKCDYINELNHGQRGVVFATGTPVTNSMSELYVMMKYLESDTLSKMGFQHFDAWAAQYGRKTSSLELTPDGTQYRYKTRFAEFVNLPELMNLYSLVSDIKTADQLKLPVPAMKYGKPQIIVAKPSQDQQNLVQDIIECFERIHNGLVEPWEDNALKETHRGRCGALDMRILDSSCEDFEGSKINLAVKAIYEEWQESTSNLGTQMVFCDLSTPHYDGTFNVYDDMKQKLIKLGIPEEQIKFIHDAKTEKQKEQFFADMRSGKIRILFGSTAKMGAGTNAQKKIVAIHHLDCPWRPGDLEQQNGRAFRRGNDNPEVTEYRYVTEGTFDAYSWQILEQKQRFISQISSGRCVERHAQDIDETVLDYATVKMLSTNDPRIKEREELRVRVAELNALKTQFNSEKFSMEDDCLTHLPQRVARNEQAIQNLEKDIATLNHNTKSDFEIELAGKVYNKREVAGKVILQKVNAYRTDGQYLPIGKYHGFRMELTYSSFTRIHKIMLCGSARYECALGEDAVGCTVRLDNTLKDLDNRLRFCREEITQAKKSISELTEQMKIPWEYQSDLEEKTMKLDKLNIALSSEIGKDKEQIIRSDSEPVQDEMIEEEQENEMDLEM